MSVVSPPFELADSEKILRTYETTTLARWFWQKPVIGYITVTDKRVLYHSESDSSAGGTKLVSEIPIEDVSGLSTWVGNSFNWLGFVLFAVAMYLGTGLLGRIAPGLLYNWPWALLLVSPYVIFWMFERNILSNEIRDQLVENLRPITSLSFLETKDTAFYRRTFRGLFLVGTILIVSNLSARLPFGGQLLLLAAYFIIYRLLFGVVQSFRLTLSSKSSRGSGITINSAGLFSLFGVDATAAQTLSAAPAADAQQVARELGALILDVQQLGEMALKKWGKPGGAS